MPAYCAPCPGNMKISGARPSGQGVGVDRLRSASIASSRDEQAMAARRSKARRPTCSV